MVAANIQVTAFAKITGRLWVKNPYKNQVKVPNVKMEYMEREIEEVSRVLMIFQAWGTKDMVVQNAAKSPAAAIKFINSIV